MSRSRLAFEAQEDLIALVDFLRVGILLESAERTVEFVNHEFLRLFGVDAVAESLIGQDCRMAAKAASGRFPDPEAFLKRVEEVLRRNETVREELLELTDGRALMRDFTPIQLGPRRHGYLWVYRDWTQHAQRQAQLEAQESLNRAILEASGDAIVAMGEDGRVRLFNEAAERTFGYSRSEALGTEVAALIVPESMRGQHRAGVERVRDGAPSSVLGAPLQLTGVRRDGSEVPLDIRIQSASAENERVFVAFLRDLTQDRTREREFEAANIELACRVAQLEAFHAEQAAVNHLSELLQATRSVSECVQLTGDAVQRLFPDVAGHCYLKNPGGDELQMAFGWGATGMRRQVSRDACWATRRGIKHMCAPDQASPACSHTRHAPHSLCLPIVLSGEVAGLISIFFDEPTDGHDLARAERILPAIGDRLGFAVTNIRLTEKLRDRAARDALTGLFNRRHFHESLERCSREASQGDGALSCIVVDVDHFKAINDGRGHAVGDLVLQGIARSLASTLRPQDVLCRIGGEEFAVLLPDTNSEEAFRCGERLRQHIEDAALLEDGRVTISVGIATYPDDVTSTANLVEAADRALYDAKRTGRNRVIVHRASWVP